MTPAERALLLWMAKYQLERCHPLSGKSDLWKLIAAVEAEDPPDPAQSTLDTFGKILHAAATDTEPLIEGKSCETCLFHGDASTSACRACRGELWQPKTTEAVCPVCRSEGYVYINGVRWRCSACGGTGKEKK